MATDTKLVGSAGEHHVCAELSRRDWAPSLTRDGLARTDILAVHTETRRMIEVQVKATVSAATWMMHRKGTLASMSDHEWYVFVRLERLPDQPRCWIVPRDHVAAATWIQHMSWLTAPDAAPGTRNTSIDGARVSVETFERYDGRWDRLLDSNADVPVMLPMWMRERALESRVGLPEGHPWQAALPAWDEAPAIR